MVQIALLVKHWQMSMFGSDCHAGQALANEYVWFRLPCWLSLDGQVCTVQGALLVG
jgi:hypothetical protein